MPSYEEHNDFVSKNPYLAWYLISRGGEFRGSVYVQVDNSIGINFVLPNEEDIAGVLSFIKGCHKPLPMIQSVRRGEFFMNIPANDENLIGILEKVGKKEISRSFIVWANHKGYGRVFAIYSRKIGLRRCSKNVVRLDGND